MPAWLADFSRYIGVVKACPESQNSILTRTFLTNKLSPPSPLTPSCRLFRYGLLTDSLR